METPKRDPLLEVAVLGESARQFLQTDLGDYILKRARDEIDSATEELKKASPHFIWGRKKIVRLQGQIAVCERVIHWLAEAITDGDQATKIIEDRNVD
jgi:hypothetical protein